MIVVTGRVRIAAENRERFVAVATEMCRHSREDDGCHGYRVYADLEQDDRYIIVEEWADDDALQSHFGQPHTATFMRALRADARRAERRRVPHGLAVARARSRPRPRAGRLTDARLAGDLGDAVDVLAGDEQELVARARAARFAVWPVLVAVVELVGRLLGRPLDDQQHLRQRLLALHSLDLSPSAPDSARRGARTIGVTSVT